MPETVYRGTQKITTHYREAESEEASLKRHAQRRQQNRDIRESSRPLGERAASRASDILGNVTGAIVRGNNTLFDKKKKKSKSKSKKKSSSDQTSNLFAPRSNMFAVPPAMNPPGMGGGTGRTRSNGSQFFDPDFIPDSLRDLF